MIKNYRKPIALTQAVGFALLALGALNVVKAADHRDSPRITAAIGVLGNLDILDVYAFQSTQSSKNTVLIMTMSTDAGVITPAYFNAYGLYEFKISNLLAQGNYDSQITYQIRFSNPDQNLQQHFVVTRMSLAGARNIVSGTTNKNINIASGGKVRAGLFDDPFFFDLLAFNKFKALAFKGDPNRAAVFLNRNGGTIGSNIPNNFFGGFNCIAIVLEVPSASLQSSPANTSVGLWARTTIPGAVFSDENPEQFDRKGRPGINTVLIPDSNKDDFNSASPLTDIRFRPAAKAELGILFGAPDQALHDQVNLLLPDILTFKTNSKDGFDKLNGRRLADDVIDVELSLFSLGAVTGDSVSNDSTFFTTFPYLGTPNPKAPLHR